MSTIPVSIIILTFNEEKNIGACLKSIESITNQIIVVDSGSTDRTLEIAKSYNCEVYSHEFVNYSLQRNWAFDNVSITNEWILNMDADHRLTPELISELKNRFESGVSDDTAGFMISRRTIFMGKWIKHGGHYPVYHGILFRKDKGRCEEKEYDQHFLIDGKSIPIKGDVIDIITDSLTSFTTRHNKWSSLEVNDINSLDKSLKSGLVKADKNGNPMEKRRYQRMKYYSFPLFWRAFYYFLYRYFLKAGFLDGKQGLIFHFLQGFWFRFLVDAKLYEQKVTTKEESN